MSLIAQIQAKYPDPVAAHDDDGTGECYCVGGAIVMFADIESVWTDEDPHDIAFPSSDDLADALHELNPALPWEQAEVYAEEIIETCDDDRVAEAWAIAAQALPL